MKKLLLALALLRSCAVIQPGPPMYAYPVGGGEYVIQQPAEFSFWPNGLPNLARSY
jgi:hypothetical protein